MTPKTILDNMEELAKKFIKTQSQRRVMSNIKIYYYFSVINRI